MNGRFVADLNKKGVIRPAGSDKSSHLWMRGPNWGAIEKALKSLGR